VVPGPHLINGILDLIDNHLPMSMARLGLAAGILLASALGIVLGVEITLPDPLPSNTVTNGDHLNLVSDMLLAGISDMLLAGIVTCGFAVAFNTPWRHVGLAALGGMAGHGLRFLALNADWRPEVATFLGGLTVGVVSGWMTRSGKTPVAVIAFAGAVTMMPGLDIYQSLGGAMQLARTTDETAPAVVARTLGNASQAGLQVSGLAIGVILGVRAVLALRREPGPMQPASADSGSAALPQEQDRDRLPSESANGVTDAQPGERITTANRQAGGVDDHDHRPG